MAGHRPWRCRAARRRRARRESRSPRRGAADWRRAATTARRNPRRSSRPTGEARVRGTGWVEVRAKRPVTRTYSAKSSGSSLATRCRVQSSRSTAMRATFARRSRWPSPSLRSSRPRSHSRISPARAAGRGRSAVNRRARGGSGKARTQSLPRADISPTWRASGSPVFAVTVGHEKLAVTRSGPSCGCTRKGKTRQASGLRSAPRSAWMRQAPSSARKPQAPSRRRRSRKKPPARASTGSSGRLRPSSARVASADHRLATAGRRRASASATVTGTSKWRQHRVHRPQVNRCSGSWRRAFTFRAGSTPRPGARGPLPGAGPGPAAARGRARPGPPPSLPRRGPCSLR